MNSKWFHPVDRFFSLILAIWIVCTGVLVLLLPCYFWILVEIFLVLFTFLYYPCVMQRHEQNPDRYALKLFAEYLLVTYVLATPGIYLSVHLVFSTLITHWLGVVMVLLPMVASVLIGCYLSKRYIYWRYSGFIRGWEKKNKRALL